MQLQPDKYWHIEILSRVIAVFELVKISPPYPTKYRRIFDSDDGDETNVEKYNLLVTRLVIISSWICTRLRNIHFIY